MRKQGGDKRRAVNLEAVSIGSKREAKKTESGAKINDFSNKEKVSARKLTTFNENSKALDGVSGKKEANESAKVAEEKSEEA